MIFRTRIKITFVCMYLHKRFLQINCKFSTFSGFILGLLLAADLRSCLLPWLVARRQAEEAAGDEALTESLN